MSTILKALDRLEREKREPTARTLQQEVVAPAGSPTPGSVSAQRRPTFLAALAVGLGVGVGGIGMWLVARQPSAPVAAVAASIPAAAPQAQAAAPEAGWRIETDAGEPADPLRPAPGEVEGAVDSASDAPLLDQDVAVAAPEGEEFVQGGTPVLDPADGARPESEPFAAVAVVPPPPAAESVAAEAIETPAPRVAPAPPPPPAAAVAATSAPKPSAKPASKPKAKPSPSPLAGAAGASPADAPRSHGASTPEISVVSTVWHPAGERRHALVRLHSGETREVREGDVVDGLLVDRIEPSRVVFATGGIELVRRVGEGR